MPCAWLRKTQPSRSQDGDSTQSRTRCPSALMALLGAAAHASRRNTKKQKKGTAHLNSSEPRFQGVTSSTVKCAGCASSSWAEPKKKNNKRKAQRIGFYWRCPTRVAGLVCSAASLGPIEKALLTRPARGGFDGAVGVTVTVSRAVGFPSPWPTLMLALPCTTDGQRRLMSGAVS